MNTRREFLELTIGSVMLAGWDAAKSGTATSGKIGVPKVLDHILLGCSDLERGIAFVEERTGVKAAFGGVHPGRGTQNALLSLGERHYLEIIAPDPKQVGTGPQSSVERLGLRGLTEPRLVAWAAHPGSIVAFAEKLKKAGVEAEGPTPGSRKRPDGRVLQWQTVNLADNAGGLLPFFIEWGAESVHPSVDAPRGCELMRFGAVSPAPESLVSKYMQVGIEMNVQLGEKTRLTARIGGLKSVMEL